MKRRRAFTLIELLVVIAIIAILAAIIFPVFAQAKAAAKSTTWLNSTKQTATAVHMYAGDNDDALPFSNAGSYGACWGCGRPDYVWFELIQPYAMNFEISYCPADPFSLDRRHIDPTTQLPLSPKDKNYWYAAALRTDMGYNYEFLSPWTYEDHSGTMWASSAPINMGQAANPSGTLMFVDSVWDREPSGAPTGGGNWTVEPPCVKDENGDLLQPMKSLKDAGTWWSTGRDTNTAGWNVAWQTGQPYGWLEYGGCWPWFNKRFRVTFADSHVGTLSEGGLSAGCDVRKFWGGRTTDPSKYIWDLR